MSSISLYEDRGSYLNKMHPYTKLLYILAAVCIPLIGGKLWLFPILILCSLLLLAFGGVIKKALPLIAFSFTLILVIFLIQTFLYYGNEEVLIRIGGINIYREGFFHATRIGLNILNMLLAFAVFVLTTSIPELVDELEKNGLSPKLGYIVVSVFQILPQMMSSKDTITDAQRSRGMETEGNFLTRAKAFIPLISPVVTSSLINTRERAIALEVRGFGRKNKKTFLEDRKKHKGDRIIGAFLLLMILFTIAARLLL